MKQTTDILTKLDRRDGMTVPDGYFEDFAARMSAMLPERPEAESTVRILERPTLWTRIRPYVYMAAMFAGVWCMLKMFTLMSGADGHNAIDSNPILAEAVSDEGFINEYVIDDINQWDLLVEMQLDGLDAATLDSLDALFASDEYNNF